MQQRGSSVIANGVVSIANAVDLCWSDVRSLLASHLAAGLQSYLFMRRAALVLTILALIGCRSQPIAPNEPSSHTTIVFEFSPRGFVETDILFVIDSSATMSSLQDVLADQLEVMVRELVQPSDSMAPALDDVHIGVITSDLGSGGLIVDGCSGDGDDGVLRGSWLSHAFDAPDDGTDPDNPPIWEDLTRVGMVGTDGCLFEQPMEATYRALVEHSQPGGPNEGFLRGDSILAIIFITDEDDCSARDDSFFDPARDDLEPLNLRCALNESELHPISRYHDDLIDLLGGHEDRFVVAVIASVPVDGSWNPGDPIERLRDLRQLDPENNEVLVPTCNTAMGSATPPVRLAELAYSFGNGGILESICYPDWTSVLRAITRRQSFSHHFPACFWEPLPAPAMSVCRMIETLDDDRLCPHLADPPSWDRQEGWHVDLGVLDGHRRCEILPADFDGDGCPDGATRCDEAGSVEPDTLQGWFVNTRTSDCSFGEVQLTFRRGVEPRSHYRFECDIDHCPLERQCPSGERLTDEGCFSYSENCAPDEELSVFHISEDICGWTYARDYDGSRLDLDNDGEPDTRPCGCFRCSPSIGSVCDLADDIPAEVRDRPVLGSGGCCAEGFHCAEDECVPNRTTTWCEGH